MYQFRRAVMWAGLILIILLIFLSIYGAFLGAERAGWFFNSIPLAVFWPAFALLLLAGILAFRRLIRVPGLLLIHLGCICVLTGAMTGSEAGHKLAKELFGIHKVRRGYMAIYKSESENSVQSTNSEQTGQLPFDVMLKDFRMEYYDPGYLLVQTRDGQSRRIPIEIDREFSLGPRSVSVTPVRVFKNLKISLDSGQAAAFDDPRPGSNAAVKVLIKYPDGTEATQYIFELFPGRMRPEDKFLLTYHRVVKDYISDLQIISDDKVLAEKSIEVNRPLHFGGYNFYQHSYDDKEHSYTVLMVASDSGLWLVYAGYAMLSIGVFRHFWISVSLVKCQ